MSYISKKINTEINENNIKRAKENAKGRKEHQDFVTKKLLFQILGHDIEPQSFQSYR